MADVQQQAASRSPNYPSYSLPDALEAAGKLWAKEKRTPVSNDTAAQHFGYKSLSGPARVMIGSLRQYGLIERTSDGHFKLTDRAIRALHGTPEQRQAAIGEAALSPALFRDLARTHMDASDATIRSYLVTNKDFIDSGARKLAAAFRATMNIAKVESPGYDDEKDGGQAENKRPLVTIAAGDFVQWESGGVLQFPDPLRVRAISTDGAFVFVEGSDTGIPMEQVSKVEAPLQQGAMSAKGPNAIQPSVQLMPPMNWVLSVPRGVRAQLTITGNVKAADLKRLKAQIDFLVESFDETEDGTER